MNADEIAEKIYATLNGQRFADWYTSGRFDDHISGTPDCPDKGDILDDIKKHFNLTSQI
jgi:hypothetical protein